MIINKTPMMTTMMTTMMITTMKKMSISKKTKTPMTLKKNLLSMQTCPAIPLMNVKSITITIIDETN